MPKMAVNKVAFWTKLKGTKWRNGPNKIIWTERQKDCILGYKDKGKLKYGCT